WGTFTIASWRCTASTGRGGNRRPCWPDSRAKAVRSGHWIARETVMQQQVRALPPDIDRHILPADMVYEQEADGTIRARSPHRLGPYPERLTDRLIHWAGVAPDRTFLAERDNDGSWRHLTYGDALTRVRRIAQAF